jgi:hypothetical protein
MLAARLLGLGLERGSADAIEEYFDAIDEAGIAEAANPSEPNFANLDTLDNPADNSYGAVTTRYLGVQLPKKWGAFDWALQPGPEQRQYIQDDVRYLLPLWTRLEAELGEQSLMSCFRERMEFAPHLNTLKMTGIPINRVLCEA